MVARVRVCTSTKICNNACNVASERLKRWQNTTAYQAIRWTWKQARKRRSKDECIQKTVGSLARKAKGVRETALGCGTMATVMSLGGVQMLGGVEVFLSRAVSFMLLSLATSPKAAMLTSPPTQPPQLYTAALCPALLLQGCLRVHRHNAQESATHVPFSHHPESVSTPRTQEAAGAQADDEARGCQRSHVSFCTRLHFCSHFRGGLKVYIWIIY